MNVYSFRFECIIYIIIWYRFSPLFIYFYTYFDHNIFKNISRKEFLKVISNYSIINILSHERIIESIFVVRLKLIKIGRWLVVISTIFGGWITQYCTYPSQPARFITSVLTVRYVWKSKVSKSIKNDFDWLCIEFNPSRQSF